MNNTEYLNHKDNDNLSAEQREILKNIPIPQTVNVHIENNPEIDKDIRDMNARFKLSQKIYEDVLAPQLEKNEDLKRQQKETLVKQLFKLLRFQFVVTYIFVFLLILSIIFSGEFHLSDNMSVTLQVSDKVILNLIKFIEFYVASIVVELISILFFIVKNVFDTSIVELIKGFDKRDDKLSN